MRCANRWLPLVAAILLVVALALVAFGCAVPQPCQQPAFTTAPGHAHPPIEVIC